MALDARADATIDDLPLSVGAGGLSMFSNVLRSKWRFPRPLERGSSFQVSLREQIEPDLLEKTRQLLAILFWQRSEQA